MAITRRNLFKVAGVTAAAAATTTLTGCASSQDVAPQAKAMTNTEMLLPKSNGKRVVIIGGGFGGLTTAKYLRKGDKSLDVVVLEQKDIFMSCPFSNSLLGGLEEADLDVLTRDYYSGATNNGYELIQTKVTNINRKTKMVETTKGVLNYDILVLAPGISYDYESQFPNWSAKKIREVQQKAPAGLMPGSEHLALKRLLEDMDDGNIIITKPNGKYKCPPAPFERAAMIANYMKKEEIDGKVIILNANESVAKGAAFKESWNDIYGDLIEHRTNCTITNVDFDKGIISYDQIVGVDKDEEDIIEKKTEKFAVLNLIPQNKANPVIQMAEIDTNSWGAVKMNGASFRSKSDESIYAVGDIVGHAIPPSGQTANWSGKEAAKEIIAQLNGKSYKLDLPYKAANVCFSMVGENPEEAIMVTHDFSFNGSVIKGKGNVPHPRDGKGKFRSKGTAKATREWYRGIMDDMFL